MLTKPARRQRIKELLADNQVFSQEQLAAMLRATPGGADVTQATLSRDLRDLGVVKGRGGYQLMNGSATAASTGAGARGSASAELQRVLPGVLLSAEVGGNLVVLHTQPAHANPLAIELDRAQLADVLGTIAGDDTVFVAARTPRHAAKLLRDLRRWAGWN
jgi:transcriptional regulator of arginine metabolism